MLKKELGCVKYRSSLLQKENIINYKHHYIL